jgi:hypothetical protein
VQKVLTSQKNYSVAFGIPKHSQPDDPTRAQRLRHHKIPPIAAVDAQTIAVGNLPIQFSWASKDLSSGDDRDCIRTTDQILQTLQSPVGIQNQDLQKKVAEKRDQGSGKILLAQKRLTTEEKAKHIGPACYGPSIEDLFAHSYTPPRVNR